jgi:hypothetical protein
MKHAAFTMVGAMTLILGACAPAGPRYEVVQQALPWSEAAAWAKAKGGRLAEIGSAEELKTVRTLVQGASLDLSATVAPDGGNGAYVWLGANDVAEEGAWLWDGDNDGTGTPFWTGTVEGSAVAGAFTAWGYEPDDYLENQDALGLSVNGWPLGTSGQWNDVAADNKLFFVVEYLN